MLSFTLKFADSSRKKAKIDDETCTAQYETPSFINKKSKKPTRTGRNPDPKETIERA